jgi:hypothetical protein
VESSASAGGLTFLADYNLEGQAIQLWRTLAVQGWLDLLPLRLMTLRDLGLPNSSTDRDIWRHVQANQLVLLTGNRSMKGPDSLEETLRDEGTPASLPVITVSRADRLDDPIYRERCATRLVEIATALDDYRGTGRIYIP